MGQKKSVHLEQEMSPVVYDNCVGSEYIPTGKELRKFSNVIADEFCPFLANKIATMDFDTSYITKCPTNEGYLLFLCKNGDVKGKIVVTVCKFIPSEAMSGYLKEFKSQ
jgi:hypothetical protein